MGITFSVNEEGTLKADFTFTDSAGDSFTPDTAYWQLTKASDGSVVNNRSFANGNFSGTTVVMYGNDLALDATGDIERIFTAKGTYSSDYGSGLTWTMSKKFKIKNILAIT